MPLYPQNLLQTPNFKHCRKVEHREGQTTYQVAALKKSLFSLGDLAGLMRAACARYLAFLSALEDRSGGSVNLERITAPARDEQHRSHRGFNFFAAGDLSVLLAILRGEYHLSGLSNRLLQRVSKQNTSDATIWICYKSARNDIFFALLSFRRKCKVYHSH
jgi:hypothetical protein